MTICQETEAGDNAQAGLTLGRGQHMCGCVWEGGMGMVVVVMLLCTQHSGRVAASEALTYGFLIELPLNIPAKRQAGSCESAK